MRQSSSRKMRSIGLLAIVIIATMAWFGFHIRSLRSAEFKRAQHAFQQMSLYVAKHEEVVSLDLTPVHAGAASYPDGTRASLWVTNPAPLGIRSGCFYVDEQKKSGLFESGASGFAEFACAIPGKQVTLERQGSIVIGYVGLWPAHTVLVTTNGTTTKLPVTLGYFILPGSLSADLAAKFTITLMSKAGVSLDTVTDLQAPGSASLLGEPSHNAGISPSGAGWALTTAGLELTADGGNSFSRVPYPIPVLNIDDVVVKGPHVMVAGMTNFLPVLKSSNDVGGTWKSVTLPAGSGNAGSARFVTQNGTLIGMLVTDVTSSNFSAAEWYATPDAGVTWTHHSIPEGGVVTAAGGDLWLAGGPQFASLYKSADLGVTWSKVSTPFATMTNGAALSVPGQLKNGNVILVATTPNVGPSAIFRVNVYVSSDLGAWKVLARTSLIGQIESGVGVAASVIANSVWLGGPTDQGIAVISTKGTMTKTSNMKAFYPGGLITSIMPFGNSSAWVTTVNSKCPSGKASCREINALIGTANSGKTWSFVDLSRMPTS